MTTTSLLEKEVRAALGTKTNQSASCKELDRLCREIQKRKSFSVFYACFVEIMSTCFCTVKNDFASAWINAIPQQCLELFTPKEGPIFDLVFLFATFPRTPIDFPVHYLPASTQRALQRPGGSREQALSPLYTNKVFRGAGKTLSMEFSIYEYFFYAFTVHPLYTPSSAAPSVAPPGFGSFGMPKPTTVAGPGDAYQNLLQEYLDHFFSHSYGPEETRARLQYYFNDHRVSAGSSYISGPQLLRERAKEFLLVLSEFWFPSLDVEDVNELNYTKPPLSLLTSVQRFVGHLVLHPAMQCNKAAEDSWCMSGEFRLIRPALFALLRITFKCHESWDDCLTKIVETWQYVLEPWKYELVRVPGRNSELRARPPSAATKYSEAWKPYLIANVGFYTTVLVDFLELVSTLDFSASEKQRLPLLRQVAAVLGVFVDESKAGGESLVSAIHELERQMYFNNPVSQREMQGSKVLREEYAQLSQRHLPRGFQHYRPLIQSSRTEQDQYKIWIGKFIIISGKNTSSSTSSSSSSSRASSAPPAPSGLAATWNTLTNALAPPAATKSPPAPPPTFQEEMKKIEDRMRVVFAISEPVVPLFRDNAREAPKQRPLTEPKWWQKAFPFLAPGYVYVREPYNPESRGRLSESDREMLLRGKLVCSRLDVPSWGSVWDRPPSEGESLIALLILKNISFQLNFWFFTYLDQHRTAELADPEARKAKIEQIVTEGEGPINLRGLASYKAMIFFMVVGYVLYLFLLRVSSSS